MKRKKLPRLNWSKHDATHHAYLPEGHGIWIWAMEWYKPLARTDTGWGPGAYFKESGKYLPLGYDWRTSLVARPTEEPT